MPETPQNKLLAALHADFLCVASTLYRAAQKIRSQGFSQYPLFAAAQEPISIGSLLIKKGEQAQEWNYYASFLEELLQRALITEKEKFIATYKDTEHCCCLLALNPEGADILYLPYPKRLG